jgi:hypothetical protein
LRLRVEVLSFLDSCVRITDYSSESRKIILSILFCLTVITVAAIIVIMQLT